MDQIAVRRNGGDDPLEFEVVVRQAGTETHHAVTMVLATHAQLGAEAQTAEQCVEAAFRFLLDREPNTSILRRFDITAISRYFPEFEQVLPRYLAGL